MAATGRCLLAFLAGKSAGGASPLPRAAEQADNSSRMCHARAGVALQAHRQPTGPQQAQQAATAEQA